MKRTPLRRPIPPEQRKMIAEDIFFKSCCIRSAECSGRIEIHHNFSFAGRRTSDYWSYLPVCSYHHRTEAKHKKELNAVMFTRKSREEIKKQYPKSTI